MKSTIKKIFITYLVIICCIYTPTAQAANWSFGGFNFGNGSLNIVKDGVKITTAPVSTAPITSNLGSKILSGALRGAGFLSALSLAVGIAEDAIDWVLDPANNQIKYRKKPLTGDVYRCNFNQMSDSADMLTAATFAADAVCRSASYNTTLSTIQKTANNRFSYNCASGAGGDLICNTVTSTPSPSNVTPAVKNGEKHLVDYVRQPDGKSLGTPGQVI